jgi:hypothetical protein
MYICCSYEMEGRFKRKMRTTVKKVTRIIYKIKDQVVTVEVVRITPDHDYD